MSKEEYILADLCLQKMTYNLPVNFYPFFRNLLTNVERDTYGDEVYLKLMDIVIHSKLSDIRNFLLEQGYIVCVDSSLPKDKLVEKGKEAKDAGGHEKYLIELRRRKNEERKLSWPQRNWHWVALITLVFTLVGEAILNKIFQSNATQTTQPNPTRQDTIIQVVHDTFYIYRNDSKLTPNQIKDTVPK